MATLVAQRLSRTLYLADGTTTSWNFNFAGGYIDKAHVNVVVTPVGGVETAVPITAANFIGPAQLLLTPPVAAGALLVIYRDTPKDLPLVDFTDGAGLSEAAMDVNAKQAVFIAAEVADGYAVADVNAAMVAAAQAQAAATAASQASADAQAAAGVLRGRNQITRLSGTGQQTAFPVLQPSEDARCDVFVQGIYQHTGDWELTAGVLSFVAPPPAGIDNIEVVVSKTLPPEELTPIAQAAAASAQAAAASAQAAASASRLVVGTVTTLPPGSVAAATITGPAGAQVVSFAIPRGEDGQAGAGSGDMVRSVYDPDNDGKVVSAVTADMVPWAGVSGKPSTFAPAAHTHPVAALADATAVGTSVLLAASAEAARAAIGAGVGDVTTSGAQALTNKTVFAFGAQYNAGSSGAAKTIDFGLGQKQVLVLSANTTVTFAFPGVGNYQLIVRQDATGGRAVTWSGVSLWVGSATAPALNTAPNGYSLVSVFWDGVNVWLGAAKVSA